MERVPSESICTIKILANDPFQCNAQAFRQKTGLVDADCPWASQEFVLRLSATRLAPSPGLNSGHAGGFCGHSRDLGPSRDTGTERQVADIEAVCRARQSVGGATRQTHTPS
jgi:hypothetical protein